MKGALRSAALLAAAFWVLVEGDVRYPYLAAAVIVIAAGAGALGQGPGPRLRLARLPLFLPWFLGRALASGADVALRAVRERRVQPMTIRFPSRLPPGAPRVFFAAALGLLPGTVTTRVEGDVLDVHVLDRELSVEEGLAELERRVAELFRVP